MIGTPSLALEALETPKITEGEIDEYKAFFIGKCKELAKLVTDYLDKNCVNFKKKDKKEEMKNEINEKFENIYGFIQPETNAKTIVSDTKYSNGILPNKESSNSSYGFSKFSSSS